MQLIMFRAARFLVLFYIGAVTYRIGALFLGWSERLTSPEAVPIVSVTLTLVVLFTLMPARETPASRWLLALWVPVFLVSIPFVALKYALGVSDMESILVFFEWNTVSTAAEFGEADFGGLAFKIVAISFGFLLATSWMHLRVKYFWVLLLGLCGAFIALHPVTQYFIRVNFPNAEHVEIYQARSNYKLEITSRPAKKKNLVVIYLESLERGYLTAPELQPYTKPLQQLVRDGVEFSNVAQVRGTHYSAAGTVATQCGVPLLPGSTFNVYEAKIGNTSGVYNRMTCLGDVLKADGYDSSFFMSSDLDEFSYRTFLSGHSWNELYGDGNVTDQERQEYGDLLWGVADELIFKKAREKLTVFAKQDVPFLLAVVTISTHGPDGFSYKNCNDFPDHTSRLPAALSCTSKHVLRLVNHVADLGLNDDTVIAIMSDHLAFNNVFTAALDANGPRRNLFFLLNAGDSTIINKSGTAFDIYPTILDAMGYGLKNGRGNMGVSLLSDRPSMASQYGVEKLSSGIEGNRNLANWLWRSKDMP